MCKRIQRTSKDKFRERNREKIACDNYGIVVTRHNSEQHKLYFKCNFKQVDPKYFNFNKVKQ